MARQLTLFFTAVLTVIVFIMFEAQAADIAVKIKDPSRDGTEVRKIYIVNGTASIPSGAHLWVLARREDFEGLWWPQGEGKINPINNKWKVSVIFGTEEDIGWAFDIAAVVVPTVTEPAATL